MRVIAHRGASGFAPENTLAAFRLAAQAGASFIETDLQLTSDARLVAIHDETLDRTTNGSGRVSDATLDALRKLDAGAWFRKRSLDGRQRQDFPGERIPTIEEVLAFSRDSNVGLYLEIKPHGRAQDSAEQALADALHAANALECTVVLSFDLNILTMVRHVDPAIVCGYLYSERRHDGVAASVGVGAQQLLPRADRITQKLVDNARRNGLSVIAWTVNARRQMKELIGMGVDGIITNYPDKLVALAHE